MPFLAPVIAFLAANAPAITAAAAIAGTGVSVGETLANQPGGGPAQPAAPAQPQVQPAQPAGTNPALASLIAQQAPTAQAQTGGSLAPPAFSELVANLTGNPGDTQGVQNVLFGQGGQGLSDMLSQLSPAPAQSLTTPTGGG